MGFGTSFLADRKNLSKSKCQNDIKQGLQNGTLEPADVDLIAKRWNQDRQGIYWILSNLLRESLISSGKEDQKNIPAIRILIEEHKRLEPYAELPESIRIHMQQVAERFTKDGDKVLSPLATAISDVMIKADKQNDKQWKFTIWSFLITVFSFVVGVASLVFAIWQLQPQKNGIPLSAPTKYTIPLPEAKTSVN